MLIISENELIHTDDFNDVIEYYVYHNRGY